MTGRRKIASIVLSTVLLPMFLLTTFHHHETYSETNCEGCSQSIPHSHFDQSTDACLVCQFLTLPWLVSAEAERCTPVSQSISLEENLIPGPYHVIVASLTTRAPPVLFC